MHQTTSGECVTCYSLRQELTWTHYRMQVFASKYQLHLPTEQQLLAEVRKELERLSEKGEATI